MSLKRGSNYFADILRACPPRRGELPNLARRRRDGDAYNAVERHRFWASLALRGGSSAAGHN